MDKAPDAFRTISEVADELDIPQHVLRFWETRFAQIKPMKRSGGRRYYRPDDVDLLKGIRRLLYGEGYTIRGVQRILKEHGIKSVQGLADQPRGLVRRGRGGDRPQPAGARGGRGAGRPSMPTTRITRARRRKSTSASSIPTTTASCCRSARAGTPGPVGSADRERLERVLQDLDRLPAIAGSGAEGRLRGSDEALNLSASRPAQLPPTCYSSRHAADWGSGEKNFRNQWVKWSEREDLNLRPLTVNEPAPLPTNPLTLVDLRAR